jgi:hypothetical protein
MTPQDAQSSHADHRHEPTDMHLRSVVLPGLALGGMVLVFSLTAWWMLNAFAARPLKPDVALSPLAQMPQIPPQPRLQGHPAVDLANLNAAYDAILNSYGWVDKNAGRVHIPIEQAKDLVLYESRTGHRFGANAGRKMP